MLLEIYDPEYYVAFSLAGTEAVRLVDAPENCGFTVRPAGQLDAGAAEALAAIGPDQRELPPEMQALTGGLENSAEIMCGGGAAIASTDSSAQSAADAASDIAGAQPGDLTALPSDAATDVVEPSAGTATPVASPGLMAARIAALQAAFNRDLTEALKGLKEGGAFWWLGGISFLYGIVHAAGPGHGKVVISSYLLANEQRVRRGVAIAFLSAFVQAVVAVGLIAVLALALDMTSRAITGTARIFEAGSFALVALLGVYLLVRKGTAAWAVLRGGDPHAGHSHGASPSPAKSGVPDFATFNAQLGNTRVGWGGVRGGVLPAPASLGAAAVADRGSHHAHAHGDHVHPTPIPSPQGGGELGGATAAVLSVGIRPCSGALVVLVFALAQGVFWAGIASTFLMALGTALTVAALAALAVGAKDIARRMTGGDGRRAGRVMLALELVAALFIAVLGAVLFVSTLYGGSSIG